MAKKWTEVVIHRAFIKEHSFRIRFQLKKPSLGFNFLHIFRIPSSSRHEKCCLSLQTLFWDFNTLETHCILVSNLIMLKTMTKRQVSNYRITRLGSVLERLTSLHLQILFNFQHDETCSVCTLSCRNCQTYEASSYPKEHQGIKSKVKSLLHTYNLVDLRCNYLKIE